MEDFRFWTVARKYAFAKSKINIREAIPENIDGSNTQDAKTDLENAKADAKKLQKKITKKQTKTVKNKIPFISLSSNESIGLKLSIN